MILNPVVAPPFLRVDLYAIELHGEMDDEERKEAPAAARLTWGIRFRTADHDRESRIRMCDPKDCFQVVRIPDYHIARWHASLTNDRGKCLILLAIERS